MLTPLFCGKDCGGTACPLLATVENGRVTGVTNNPAGGKYLKGCLRSRNLLLEHYAPDRLLHPLVRVGPRGSGQFRKASWEEALDITADKLGEIRARYGPTAVLNRSSAGGLGALHCTYALLGRFLDLFGGCTRLTGSYSAGAASFVLPYLFGEQWTSSGFDSATIRDARMIILWGANVRETCHGAEVPRRLIQAKRCGAQIVVIDPRRSATAKELATWWIPCRPGSDAALMLAVLYVLFTENLADRPFIDAHSAGFERLEQYVLGLDGSQAHTPAWAEAICGVPAGEIARFARLYAATKPAMLFPGYSIQRVFAGEETYRLTVALQIATGNFGQRGGSTGSINSLLPSPRVGRMSALALHPAPALPVLRWPDAVLQGRSGGYPTDIHAIYNLGANSINQGGDARKSMAAFVKVDFAVCHELFLTPTARFCDVVFPAASPLEKEDIGIPWAGNYLLYKPQTVPPRRQSPGERGPASDYDILCDLAERLGFLGEFSEGRSASEWVQRFLEQSEVPDLDQFRRTGIYFAPDQERVGLADFAADPLRHPLTTPSGKVEIASPRYQADTGFPAIPTWQSPPEDPRYPLRLITPKSPHRTHSQGSNLPELRHKVVHALVMHPLDAASRNLHDGQMALLFNERGATRLPVHLSTDIIPGVVSLPEGIWVEVDTSGIDQAGSANMLTATEGTGASTSCIMHGIGVQVCLEEEDARK